MTKRNDRIKYYGQNDHASYHYLNHLSSFLEETDFNQPISDINTAIEWNNVIKLLALNIKPDNLTEDSFADLQKHAKRFPRSIGMFLQTINDDNLLEIFKTVDILYKSDFFELFDNYKLSKRITSAAFSSFMHESTHVLDYLLNPKYIANYKLMCEKHIYDKKYFSLYEKYFDNPEFMAQNDRNKMLELAELETRRGLKKISPDEKIIFLKFIKYSMEMEQHAYSQDVMYAKILQKLGKPIDKESLEDYTKYMAFSEKIDIVNKLIKEEIYKARKI